jgi:hypothetical protein
VYVDMAVFVDRGETVSVQCPGERGKLLRRNVDIVARFELEGGGLGIVVV